MVKSSNFSYQNLQSVFSFLLITLSYVSPDGVVNESGERLQLQPGFPILAQIIQPVPYSFNVTINHLSPRSVEVSWNCKGQSSTDKYEVTLKPLEASYRIVENVPFNQCRVLLQRLDPNTSYQVVVVSISGRVKKRSSSIIFRTFMEMDEEYEEIAEEPESTSDSSLLGNKDRLRLPRVRLVEVSLVGMALILWAGAIVLFFHRWGKIRMLLPYQPDFKELKRNNSVCAHCSMTPHHQYCRLSGYVAAGDFVGAAGQKVEMVPVVDSQCSPIRPRLNSFFVVDVNECRKDHIRLCRKSRSADQIAKSTLYSSTSQEASQDEVEEAEVECSEF